ncbi:nucleoside triphosphate pyrophosphohydrolase [Verrucomicrobium sp. BvORR034]|uniref:nucleoside triphosphate pyrophosphohydrolase n=1 Tax=Verrucomicrobium sp. BvORR034 TaxID=1396418 RepID=UPI0007C710E8|nr:nucleoside triphosphate pyrophosphohydrolase [Verrucomicrobium sp. BvORR034]
MSTVPTPAPAPTDDALADLRAVVHRLRAPGGCPWDQEQTHETLIPHLIEEAYEVAEAIRNGDMAHLREELGDLLLQPVLHAEIASETGVFDLDSIARELTEKLIRRHPHVFGDTTVDGSAGVLKQWDEIKKQEKGGSASDRKPHLHGVSHGLPALMRAQKIQKKAAKVGFDWPDFEQVVAKVHEEVQEIAEAVAQQDQKAIEDEVGDLLYSVVNVARRLGVDAETALAAATAKFERRFGRVEEIILAQGKTLEDSTLEEMDAVWEATKHLPASAQS